MKDAPKLKALLISNGIEGLLGLFQPNDRIEYSVAEVGPNFAPELEGYDVVIVPNGSDHVAMYRIRDRVARYLAGGGVVCCFDGWFTDWVPNHRWIMDNSQRTMDVRYRIREDLFGLGSQFSAEDLTFSHGISGWWSCGYIQADPRASVLLEDTWGRPLMVIDTVTTPGTLILTASGPLGDFSYATTDDSAADRAMVQLYRAVISFIWDQKFALV